MSVSCSGAFLSTTFLAAIKQLLESPLGVLLPAGFDAPVIRKPYDVTQVAAAVAELLKGQHVAAQ